MSAQDTFHTLKLSGALLAELGATPADFADKLAAFLADAKATKVSLASAESAASATASAGADLAARLAAVEKSVAGFKAVDATAILAQAKETATATASSVAASILAKSGGAPLPTATVEGNAPAANQGEPSKADQFRALLKTKMDAGQPRGTALAAIVKEQPELYAAWRAAGFGSL